MLNLSRPQSPSSPNPRPNCLPSFKLAKATSSLGVALLLSWIDYSPDLSSLLSVFGVLKTSPPSAAHISYNACFCLFTGLGNHYHDVILSHCRMRSDFKSNVISSLGIARHQLDKAMDTQSRYHSSCYTYLKLVIRAHPCRLPFLVFRFP